MNFSFPSIYKQLALLLLMPITFIWGCASGGSSDASDQLLSGTIDYPFVDKSAPLGKNSQEDKFIMRSTVGSTEYQVEIPGAAKDYDVLIPLDDLRKSGVGGEDLSTPEGIGKPQATDQELTKNLPQLDAKDAADRQMVEGAFGVGEPGGPSQSPSYTLGIARIDKLYLRREFEYALIEINNMLGYYPTSTKLLKMKGTILMKLRNFDLAEIAWSRASELEPYDTSLQKALFSLRKKIERDKAQAKPQNATAILSH